VGAAERVPRGRADATVTLRMHKVAWKRNPRIALPVVFGVLVTEKRPPFTLRREYAVSQG